MVYLALLLSIAISGLQSGGSQRQNHEMPPRSETFFTLRTYEIVMYDGMDRYNCDNDLCGTLNEIDTFHSVAQLRDGRYFGLRRSNDPRPASGFGTLADASEGRLTQWPRRTSVPPRTFPEVPNYNFVKAYQVNITDVYVGLWQRSGPGTLSQTVVVLFDGGNVEGSGVLANCGGYRILASVYQKIDVLEVRSILHMGDSVNLAHFDPASQSIWIAKMILPQAGPNCG